MYIDMYKLSPVQFSLFGIKKRGKHMSKLFKKTVAVLIAAALIFCGVPISSARVYALDDKDITAAAAVLIEPSTGSILYEKNSHDIRPCASITKLMTLILVFEAIDAGKISYEDTVVTSAHAAGMGGSDIWLKEGERMSVDDMIKATVVASANDAAVALAEHICGSEDAFVVEMNKKAEQLGMNDTVFKNCNGLDEEGHVTSAYDVALMSCEAVKHEKIFEYAAIWLDYLRDGATQIVNTNKLLKTYKGITGLKTGTTSGAGACIAASAERDGLALIAVVLGSKTGKERFTDAQKILDYGFAEYTMYTPEIPDDAVRTLDVSGGMDKTIRTQTAVDGRLLIKKGSESSITTQAIYDESIAAPVEIGDRVGVLQYLLDDEIIAEYPITSADRIEKINFWAVLKIIFENFIQI